MGRPCPWSLIQTKDQGDGSPCTFSATAFCLDQRGTAGFVARLSIQTLIRDHNRRIEFRRNEDRTARLFRPGSGPYHPAEASNADRLFEDSDFPRSTPTGSKVCTGMSSANRHTFPYASSATFLPSVPQRLRLELLIMGPNRILASRTQGLSHLAKVQPHVCFMQRLLIDKAHFRALQPNPHLDRSLHLGC